MIHSSKKYCTRLYFILTFLILLSGATGVAQKNDSTIVSTDTAAIDTIPRHSPKRATIMSACFPGLGQIYNHKYWKAPVIYAGMGATIGFAIKNYHMQKLMETMVVENQDPTSANYLRYDLQSLKSNVLFYERNKELCLIITGVIYFLNIVDATVDAYLFDFDVSKNLSLHVVPVYYNPQSLGVLCSFRF